MRLSHQRRRVSIIRLPESDRLKCRKRSAIASGIEHLHLRSIALNVHKLYYSLSERYLNALSRHTSHLMAAFKAVTMHETMSIAKICGYTWELQPLTVRV